MTKKEIKKLELLIKNKSKQKLGRCTRVGANYTGWICTECGSTSIDGHTCDGIRCRECLSNQTVYLSKGKRLSAKEEYNASLVRLGLRTANPFGGSFDEMKG